MSIEKDVEDEARRNSVDDEASEEGGGLCSSLTLGMRVLCKNKELTKVVIAAGLQQGISSLADTFVLSDLKVKYWGKHLSEYQAMASILINAVAVCCGGAFGAFSDTVDRRLAAAIFAAGTFLPGWALLVFGQTNSGLLVATVAKIVGSFGLTANVMLALANDVTPFQDRELSTGAFFACICFVNVGMTAIPVLLVVVFQIIPDRPQMFLFLQVAMSGVFFFILYTVRIHKVETEKHGGKDLVWEQESRGDREDESSEDATVVERSCKCKFSAIGPLKLAMGNRRLRRMCVAAFLLKFAGDLVMDIGGQFFYESLGLITNAHDDEKNPFASTDPFAKSAGKANPYIQASNQDGAKELIKAADESAKEKRSAIVTISVLTMLPGQVMAIPANLITGALAKRNGPLKLLRILVPVSGLLVAVGAFMALIRQVWFIAVVVICLTYASLPNVPLFRMVGGLAPPGRMGEALAAVGVCAQCASLLGNVFVALVNPWLESTSIRNPLWVYYPICGTLVMLAILPLMGTPRGGWGPASGQSIDKLHALVSTAVAYNRWKRVVVSRRRALNSENSLTDSFELHCCTTVHEELSEDSQCTSEDITEDWTLLPR